MKNKNDAAMNYYEMIKKSWTYERLTAKEKSHLAIAFSDADCQNEISGSYDQRWKQCNAIYRAFLLALGYDPITWRKPEEENNPRF